MDETTQEQLSGALDSLVVELLQWSTSVALVLPADVGPNHPAGGEFPETDPERMQIWRDTTTAVANQHSGAFVVDFAGWIGTQRDAELRPDGVHLDIATSLVAAEALLPDAIVLAGPSDSESGYPQGGILLAGDQLARPIASELVESSEADLHSGFRYSQLPTLPRDEVSRRSWESRLVVSEPEVVVLILEHWETILAATDMERGTYDSTLREFLEHLLDSVELVVIGVPVSFGDPVIDSSVVQIESALIRLAQEQDRLQVIRLSGGDGLTLDGNAVGVGSGWASEAADEIRSVLDAR